MRRNLPAPKCWLVNVTEACDTEAAATYARLSRLAAAALPSMISDPPGHTALLMPMTEDWMSMLEKENRAP